MPVLTPHGTSFCTSGWPGPLYESYIRQPIHTVAKRSSQLKPSSPLRWRWASFGHPLGLSWTELAWIWSSSNFRPTRAKYSTVWPHQPTQANSRQVVLLLLCTTRSYSDNLNGFLQAGSTWRYRLATRRCKFWFCNLARVGSVVWQGLYAVPWERVFRMIRADSSRTERFGLWKYVSAFCFSLLAGNFTKPSSETFSDWKYRKKQKCSSGASYYSTLSWSISNFLCSLTRNVTSRSMKNLAFHSLLGWKMITLAILTTSLIHFSPNDWEDVLSELGSEGVKGTRRTA